MDLRQVTDVCSKCREFFSCELCKSGHGVGQKHSRVAEMFACQQKYRKELEDRFGEMEDV